MEAGNGDDYVEGNEGNDKIHGDDGNDMIMGGSGHDIISGGKGDDQIEGEEGNDLIYGDSGNDVILGGNGNDVIDAGAGNDVIDGDDGDDVIDGSIGNDEIHGGYGDDVLFGDTGNDVLRGDSGDDLIYGDEGVDILYGDFGDDILDGGADADLLFGGFGKDVLFGQDADDHIYGELDDDYIVGGKGNDTLDGGDGSDVYAFGKGDGSDSVSDSGGLQDIIRIANYSIAEITFTLAGTDVILSAAPDGSDKIRIINQMGGDAIEYLMFSNGQVIDMTSLAFNAQGIASYNMAAISGSALAAQTHFAGTWQEAEQDRQYMSYNTNSSWYYNNFDTSTIDNQADMELYNDVQVRATVIKNRSWHGRTTLTHHYNDYFEKSLMGTVASDRIVGQYWVETISGQGGNDQLYGNGGEDILNGGTEHDVIFGGSQGDTINANEGNDKAYGGMGNDTINGDAGNDTLYGEWDADTLNGGTGDDFISGGMANDNLSGGDGNDIVYGDDGDDTIAGNDGNDYLIGGDGNDNIQGGSGEDYIEGSEGDDILQGGYTSTGFTAGAETRVNTTTYSHQQNLSVTYLENGGYVIVWDSEYQDESGRAVYKQQYNASGDKVGSEEQVNTYEVWSQHKPDIAGLKDGGYIITWESYQQDGSGYSINAQRFDSNGAKTGVEFQVNTFTYSTQENSSVTALENGGFVITWDSDYQDGGGTGGGGGGKGVYKQQYNASGVKVGGEELVNTYQTWSQYKPSVTGLKDGGYIITWESYQQDGSGYSINAQRFDSNGAKTGVEFQVNTFTYSTQENSSVTALENGGFVITWDSDYQDGGGTGGGGGGKGVYKQQYNASGAKVGGEELVNTYQTWSQYKPSVTSLKDGGYVITWESYQVSGYGIYAQRYNSDGAKVGGEFIVNDYNNADQVMADITALENGGFVISWQSNGQDGSGWGIYQKIYSPTNTGVDGDDILRGGDGNDQLYGNAGDDLLVGGEGADYINGGDGIDTASYFESDAAVNVNLATGVESGGHASGDTIADVENVIGSDYDDTLIGNNSANILQGGYGNDNLSGGNGDDILQGGAGADILDGGAGWDKVSYADSVSGVEINFVAGTGKYGHAEGDVFVNMEHIVGSAYNDKFIVGNSSVTFQAGAGYDTVVMLGNSTDYEIILDRNILTARYISATGGLYAVGALFTFPDAERLQFNNVSYGIEDFPGDGDAVASIIENKTAKGVIVQATNGKTITLEQNATHGTATINPDLTYTYTPTANYRGADSFSIRIADQNTGLIRIHHLDVGVDKDYFAVLGAVAPSNHIKFNTNGENQPEYVNSEILTNGNIVRAWDNRNNGGTNNLIHISITDSEGVNKDIILKSSMTTFLTTEISVVALKESGFVVTYTHMYNDGGGNSSDIYAYILDNDGNVLKSEFKINTYSTYEDEWSSVAALNNGNFIVTWMSSRHDGLGLGTYSQLFDSHGNKIGNEKEVSIYSSGDQRDPSITALNDGGYYITYTYRPVGGIDYVYGVRFDENGNKIGMDDNLGNGYQHKVASLENGSIAVVYKDSSNIKFTLHDYDGDYVASGYVSTNVSSGNSRIASLKDGGFLIIWQANGNNGNGLLLYGQRFDSLGNKVGSIFDISKIPTSYYNLSVDIVSLNAEEFVVTWLGGDGNDDYGIHSKTFNTKTRTLEGTSSNDVLHSGSGDDTLIGLAGADVLDGGAGAYSPTHSFSSF